MGDFLNKMEEKSCKDCAYFRVIDKSKINHSEKENTYEEDLKNLCAFEQNVKGTRNLLELQSFQPCSKFKVRGVAMANG